MSKEENKNMTTKIPFRDFFNGMYGAVIGVSLIDFTEKVIIPSKRDNHSIHFLPHALFSLVVILFTIVMVSHDWYIKIDQVRKTYFSYIPNILSLFFIAQMLSSYQLNEIVDWYIWGGLYTFCNFINSLLQKDWKLKCVKYLAHVLIAVGAYIALYLNETNLFCASLYFGMTMIVIILFWIFIPNK